MSGVLAAMAALSPQEARELTDEIRGDAEDLYAKIIRAFEGEAHTALGYESWDAYVLAEYPTMPRLGRSERPAIAASMYDAGMTTREVASALGVSKDSVRRDLDETIFGADEPKINNPSPLR